VTCSPTSGLAEHQFINGDCYGLSSQVGLNGPTVGPAVYGPAFFNSDLGLFKNFQFSESRKLQLRLNAYNFLNHPLYSFAGGSQLNLVYDPTTLKLSNPNFGITQDKQGRRIVQVAIKFYF
jgi:hypothetical protein